MDRFDMAVELIQKAGNVLRQCRVKLMDIRQKTCHQDLVTQWDRQIEQMMRKQILKSFPEDSIIGEEYPPKQRCSSDVTWYLDPIDGTANFINQHQNYAISVGCWKESSPLFGLVLDVERQLLY